MDHVLPEPSQWLASLRAPWHAPPPPALVGSVHQLMVLRWIALCGQALAIVVSSALGVTLPLPEMGAVVAALVVLNGLTWMRVRRAAPAHHYEIATHFALDLAAFTLLLYLSGGATNPFSAIYVLHVVVMALLLPPRAAAFGTSVVIASYALVVRHYVPLRLSSGEPVSGALLTFGDGLSLALTSVVVAWFVVRIVAVLHEHERLLREAARKAQNDEEILKLGALAAGAAHELATPLTTMGIIASEISRAADTPSLRRDADALASQVDSCRQTLLNLLAAANHARAEGGGRESLDAFVRSLAGRFRRMRPDVDFTFRWDGVQPVPQIYADRALEQAVLALLNNAADASPNHVRMTALWSEEALRVIVEDRGSGVPEHHLANLGRVFFTTKPPGRGTGLGLVLATTALKALGGMLRWTNRPGGGTQAEIVLPLRGLKLSEANR
jgi:two-component system sensor histidine kinase RegB